MPNSTETILCPIKTAKGVFMLPTIPLRDAMAAVKQTYPAAGMDEIKDRARLVQLRYAIQQQLLEHQLAAEIEEINQKYDPQTSG